MEKKIEQLKKYQANTSGITTREERILAEISQFLAEISRKMSIDRSETQ